MWIRHVLAFPALWERTVLRLIDYVKDRQKNDTSRWLTVPVQREMERGRSPLMSIPPLRGGDFQGIRVYRSDMVLGRARKANFRAQQHRLDEPTKLSLGMVASLQSPLPFHLARSLYLSRSRFLLPAFLPPLARLIQLAISRRMDLRLPPRHHVRRRDEADGAVQSHGIVVVHILLNQAPRVLLRQRRSGPNALRLERFVPAFNFSVRLRIVRRRPDVRHARDTDEFFEVPRNELGAVVGDDPRPRLGVLLLGSFENDFDVRLRHRLAQIPVDDQPAAAVQYAAQIVERAGDVDVAHVGMPMLMGL